MHLHAKKPDRSLSPYTNWVSASPSWAKKVNQDLQKHLFIFSSGAKYPYSKGIRCKFPTNRKAVSWRHILPQHDNKVKDQGLEDSGGGERNLFWIAPVYSTNTIKLQCSILLHPHHSTLAQQIHQTRLNAFSWKWKQKTQRKEAVTVKTEEYNQVIHRENSAIY